MRRGTGTVHLCFRPEGRGGGGRVREALSDPGGAAAALAAQERLPGRRGLFLPLGTGGSSGPGRDERGGDEGAGKRPQGPQDLAPSIPRPGTARPARRTGLPQPHPGPPPTARVGGTGRAGDREPARPHPACPGQRILSCPRPLACWPAGDGKPGRKRAQLAGACRSGRGPPTHTHTPTHPQPEGGTRVLRASQRSPYVSNSITSPLCHFLLGEHKVSY